MTRPLDPVPGPLDFPDSPLSRAARRPLMLGLFLPLQTGAFSPSTLPRATQWDFEYNRHLTQLAERSGFEFIFGLQQWVGKGGFGGSHGFRDAAVELATRESLTVRELLYANGGGHQQVVGTPEEIADTVETWVQAGAVDGSNLMIDAFPTGLEDVVEHVVPLLRKRCLFQHEYAGDTLRTNLGLPPLP